ncbi:hypothetical protein KM043_005494 [Ampulex compressa]|nr:hypothetical protein KM043_005494 [Ampulex compressa]
MSGGAARHPEFLSPARRVRVPRPWPENKRGRFVEPESPWGLSTTLIRLTCPPTGWKNRGEALALAEALPSRPPIPSAPSSPSSGSGASRKTANKRRRANYLSPALRIFSFYGRPADRVSRLAGPGEKRRVCGRGLGTLRRRKGRRFEAGNRRSVAPPIFAGSSPRRASGGSPRLSQDPSSPRGGRRVTPSGA